MVDACTQTAEDPIESLNALSISPENIALEDNSNEEQKAGGQNDPSLEKSLINKKDDKSEADSL